jgi:hypothetical protein
VCRAAGGILDAEAPTAEFVRRIVPAGRCEWSCSLHWPQFCVCPASYTLCESTVCTTLVHAVYEFGSFEWPL